MMRCPRGPAHMGIHQRPVIMAHKGNGDTVAVFKYIVKIKHELGFKTLMAFNIWNLLELTI